MIGTDHDIDVNQTERYERTPRCIVQVRMTKTATNQINKKFFK